MLTITDVPTATTADADHRALAAGSAYRRVRRSRSAKLDWWRVGALALAATGHIVGFGLLAIPDTDAIIAEPTSVALADTLESDRLTLFIDLERLPAPPLPSPPPPLPPPPPVRVVIAAAVSPPSTAPVAPAPKLVEVVTSEPNSTAASMPLAPALPSPPAAPTAPTPVTTASAPQRPRGHPTQVRNDRNAYIRALMAALLQHRSYPPEARKQRARGTVHVRFSIDRHGHVLASSIARGAGFEILETAALEVLRSADPLPPIPESLGVDRLTVTVPIEYSLITH